MKITKKKIDDYWRRNVNKKDVNEKLLNLWGNWKRKLIPYKWEFKKRRVSSQVLKDEAENLKNRSFNWLEITCGYIKYSWGYQACSLPKLSKKS